jgi:hypothetical protein
MDTQVKTRPDSIFLETEELRRRMDAIDERLGIVPGPPVSPEELYARQRALGIRPEDRVASRELYRIRYGANRQEDWPDI